MNYAVVDLGYGDAGKGTVVDWLCSNHDVALVVRFNGGSQAAHNVVQPDGTHHTFRMFGSGTLAGVDTYLARKVIVDPLAIDKEAAELDALGVHNPLDKISVHPECLISTPIHASANRLREKERAGSPHGSCGRGIGETVASSMAFDSEMVLRWGDLKSLATTKRKLAYLLSAYQSEFDCDFSLLLERSVDDLAEQYHTISQVVSTDRGLAVCLAAEAQRCVFEGAQGVLLDEWWGFHPYTTWSTCTFENVNHLLAEVATQFGHMFPIDYARIGVIRSYQTRHGYGPFVSEDPNACPIELHNGENQWQGKWRTGWLDLVTLRYATIVAGGLDGIAVTHCDVIGDDAYTCEAYLDEDEGVTWSHLISDAPPNLRTRYDLVEREKTTQRLFRQRPVLRHRKGAEEIIDAAELTTQVSCVLRSYGPATDQKKVTPGSWLEPLSSSLPTLSPN